MFDPTPGLLGPDAADPSRPPAFLVSTTGCARDIRRHMGSADYSYVFVLNAFRPVLESLGTCRIIEAPESRLAHAAARAVADGFRPVHLSLLPVQGAYFTPAVPTILFPFWEFPRIPDMDFGHDTRQNWRRMLRPASLILTACAFTADAIRRAGVDRPIEVVPVPLPPGAFDVPAWDPDHEWTIECRHLVLGGDAPAVPVNPAPAPSPAAAARARRDWKHGLRSAYRGRIRPWLSPLAIERISGFQKRLLRLPETPLPLLPRTPLTLSGLVFTSIFNLSDRRKNAVDLLTAFLTAFRDRPDATLVLKLATSPTREFHELAELTALYRAIGIDHRCRLVVLTDFLDDEQMDGLLRATTYYVNTSRAEGACLPLQQALASGRPAIAPGHTAMADYMDPAVGFVVESHPEPTFWPHDPERRHLTTWQRLVWSDLCDAMLRAAEVARRDRAGYDAMAAAARRRMAEYASREQVEVALGRALRHLDAAPVGAFDWAA